MGNLGLSPTVFYTLNSKAFKKWRTTSIDERVRIAEKFTDLFVQQADEAAKELSVQMGRCVFVSSRSALLTNWLEC